MQQCTAIKRKGSADPCLAQALRSHVFCGRHARMRKPIVWVGQSVLGLPRIQACIRGWILRSRLKLAGPGVLCRKNLVNDEELVSGTDKSRQHPLDYFAIEEGGRVWWFAFSSIWKWMEQTFETTNPYTKEPLTRETRIRLRAIWSYNNRHNIRHVEESLDALSRIEGRVTVIAQTFVDNGFMDIQPKHLVEFNKSHFAAVFILLARDIETVYPVHDPFRAQALRLCRKMPKSLDGPRYVLHSLFIIKWLLSLHKDPYVMAFSVLSALYRC